MSIFDIFKKLEKESAPVTPPEYIVAGLGNPGKDYAETRHNAGFMVMDYLAEKENIRIDRAKWNALFADAEFCGKKSSFRKASDLYEQIG